MATSPDDDPDDIPDGLDFRKLSGVVRGKYAARYHASQRVFRLAPDLATAFPDEASVNNALREYLKLRESGTAVAPPAG